MKIRVECPCGYKGDVHDFTWGFGIWLAAELENRLIESEAFTTKYGKDWTVTFAWNTEKRIKSPKLSGPWIDRKYKTTRCMFDLPFFRRVPAEPKAYVPQIRQFLERVVAYLSREQIDASRIEKDIEQLLEQFCARPGMLRYDPHPYTFEADEEAAARPARSQKVKLLKTDASVHDCLKRLPRDYKYKFDVAFDATDHPTRKKGWLADYAVIDLTFVMPAGENGIPKELFATVTELFRSCATALKRNRTFFCVRIAPKFSKPDWSVALLLNDQHTDSIYQLIRHEASMVVSLLVKNSPFKEMYSDGPHALFAYSDSLKRIIGFPSQAAIKFTESLDVSDSTEKEVLSGACGDNTACQSAFYRGNAYYNRSLHQEAIQCWRVPEATTAPEAWVNIGLSFGKMGDMEGFFQSCKEAIGLGATPEHFDDPDFSEFRSHPLFAELRQMLPAKSSQSQNLPKVSRPLPAWRIPKNLEQQVADGDGSWEERRFDPILLTVMSGVEYEGRAIPLSWQIEFDPSDDRLEAANEKLESSGIGPDGDGWAEVIEKEFAKRYPKLAGELHSDSESSICVLWVESEKTCQKLIAVVWSLIYSK